MTLSIECALCGAFLQVFSGEALWQSCGGMGEVVEKSGREWWIELLKNNLTVSSSRLSITREKQ
jgi:hypothetical protein